jgi:Uma2 family endonuclease
VAAGAQYDETISLPRAVRFPVELMPPPGFDPERIATWPSVVGRLEYVGGRLLYMPPCSDVQQDTVTDVVVTLGMWVRGHPEYVLGTNEAGMRLGGATRAADAAIWRKADVGAYTGGLRRRPPLLAVEVAGSDHEEGEEVLRSKARWYLDAGVPVVWLVLPERREVVVLTAQHEERCTPGKALPSHPELPGLDAKVDDFFRQIGA